MAAPHNQTSEPRFSRVKRISAKILDEPVQVPLSSAPLSATPAPQEAPQEEAPKEDPQIASSEVSRRAAPLPRRRRPLGVIVVSALNVVVAALILFSGWQVLAGFLGRLSTIGEEAMDSMAPSGIALMLSIPVYFGLGVWALLNFMLVGGFALIVVILSLLATRGLLRLRKRGLVYATLTCISWLLFGPFLLYLALTIRNAPTSGLDTLSNPLGYMITTIGWFPGSAMVVAGLVALFFILQRKFRAAFS